MPPAELATFIDALAGVRVLDLAGPAGAFGVKLLADLGADVVKVEPPGGDPVRQRGPFSRGEKGRERSLPFLLENTNKRSVVLDLDQEPDRARFRELAASTDIVFETAKPGWMDERGIGYSALSLLNGRLVYTAVTPYGQKGPRAHYRGSDLSSQAMGGALILTGPRGGRPVRGAVRVGDKMAGYTAGYATLAALYYRNATGRGQLLDVSAQEAVLSQTDSSVGRYALGGPIPQRELRRYPVATCPAGLYPCTDGWAAIVASTLDQWLALRDWMGDDRLMHERFLQGPVRLAERDTIDPLIAEWSINFSRAYLFAEGRRRRIPVGSSQTPMEAMGDIHLRESGFFVRTAHPVVGTFEMPGAPYRLSGTPWRIRRTAPLLGEHTSEVFAELDSARVTSAEADEASFDGASPSEATRPPLTLSGVRVLDLTWGIAGPACTRSLADQGAEVIKIESEAALDPGRLSGGLFLASNRNKLSATLNLKTPIGREAFLELVKVSDVVVNNYRAGTMERLGLGYDVLRLVNPGIVLAEISGMGQTGPYRDSVSYGQVAMALAGGNELTGRRGEAPTVPGYTLPDYAGGIMAAFAVVAALISRERTGAGQHIDIPLFQVTASLMAEPQLVALVNDEDTIALGNDEPGTLVHDCFRCAGDDEWCVIVIRDAAEWTRLLEVIGVSLPSAPSPGAESAWQAAIEAWTETRTSREVMDDLQRAGIEAARVQTARDIVDDDEHVLARGYLETYDHPGGETLPVEGIPFKMSLTPARVRHPGPAFGGDNDYVFRRLLHLSDAQVSALHEAGPRASDSESRASAGKRR